MVRGVVIVCLACACGEKRDPPPASSPPPPSAPVRDATLAADALAIDASPDDAGVILIENGATPRERVRWKHQPARDPGFTLRQHSSASTNPSDRRDLTLVFTFSLPTWTALPDGRLQARYDLSGARVVGTPNMMGVSKDAIEGTLREQVGTSRTRTWSTRGALEPPTESSTKPSGKIVDQALAMIDDYQVVFPDQPIGVGARWEVRRTAIKNGATFDDVLTCSLLSRDGDTLRIRVGLRGRARTTSYALPNRPDVRATTVEGSLDGTGESTIDLARQPAARLAATTRLELTSRLATTGIDPTTVTNRETTELELAPTR